ncbi:MAG: SUMF1/EgtB/PvdO family nonheme iron enzyme [bacterium]
MNRGGSWNNDAQNCRTANRNNNTPDNRNNNIGFRLVSPKLKRMDGFPLLNRLLSRPCKGQIKQQGLVLVGYKPKDLIFFFAASTNFTIHSFRPI